MKSIGVFLVAAWFVLAGLSLAHAEPITIALFGAAFAATTAGAVVSYLIGAVIAYGVSLLSQALLGEEEQAQTQGVKLTVQMGDDKPMSFIAGTTATAGKRKYIGAWGKDGKTPNAYLVDVIEIGNMPNLGLPGFWVDDQKVTVLWGEPAEQGYPVQEYRVNGKDYLWFRVWDGTQTTADPYLLNKFGAHPDRPYEPEMIGRGCPYIVATARLNQELFPNQPQFLIEPPVSSWYDVRKDSTAGGSGTQRWDNPATWAPSDNPVVIIYNIIRGIYYNGEWFYGGQNLPAFRLPVSNWMVAANECDRLIPLAGGGSERQFRCGTVISCDMEPLAVIEKLKKACNGRIAENGGVFKMLVGAPGAAVYSFSDGDVVVTKGQSFTPFPGLSETYNGIEATYPEPLEKWATKDAPARYSSALEAADGNRRLASGVTFEAVPFPVQVQRLMKLLLEEDRRFRVHSFYLPPDAWTLEPNDVVSWTSVRNGYVNKKFLVVRIDGERSMNQLVVLKEIDPSDYDWSTDEELPISTGPVGPIVNPSHPMFGWQALPAIFYDANGNARRPSIEVFYAGDQDGVDRVRVKVFLKEDGSLAFDGEIPYDAPLDEQYSTVLNGVFLPKVLYQVQGIFVSNIGKNFSWSGLIDVTTPDVRLGSDDIFPGGLVDSILSSLGKHLEWLAEGTHYARDELDRLNLIVTDAGAQSTRDKKELLAEVGSANAKYSNEILVIAKANEAAVIRLEELNAAITDPDTGLTANANAIDSLSVVVNDPGTGLVATANALSALTVNVGKFSASGLFRTTAEATAAGALATIGLSVSATGGGATSQAAMILSALAGGLSEIGFLADRIYMVNGASKRRPFIFSGGVLYLDDVRVTSLSALSATLGNVDISNAIIGNLIVGTSNLGFNSVTDKTSYSGGSTGTQGTWTAVAIVPTQNPNPNPVFCEYGLTAISHANGGGAATSRIRWRRDGVVLKEVVASATGTGGVPQDRTTQDIGFFIDDTPVQGTNTYVLEVFNELGGGTVNSSGYVKMIWWKR